MVTDGVALEVDLLPGILFLAFGLWIPISCFSALSSYSRLAEVPKGSGLGLEKEQIFHHPGLGIQVLAFHAK